MDTVPLYREMTKENKILGLEYLDLLIVLLIFLILFWLSRNLIVNALILAFTYSILRIYKRNKPPKYTECLLRFLTRPNRFRVERETQFQ